MWEQLLKPGLTGAPQFIEWGFAGLGIFLATFIGRINIMRGKLASAAARNNGPVGEIVGAIISNAMAEVIVAAIEKQTNETEKMTTVLRAVIRELARNSNSLQSNTDSAKYAGSMIDEARTDIRRLTDEMMRGK